MTISVIPVLSGNCESTALTTTLHPTASMYSKYFEAAECQGLFLITVGGQMFLVGGQMTNKMLVFQIPSESAVLSATVEGACNVYNLQLSGIRFNSKQVN